MQNYIQFYKSARHRSHFKYILCENAHILSTYFVKTPTFYGLTMVEYIHNPVKMTFNHQYVYMIRDTVPDTILFMGAVTEF